MRQRFVVLEGIDGVGKSSIRETLCHKFPLFQKLDIIDSSRFEISDFRTTYPTILRLFEHLDTSKVYVLDRFLLTDIIYDKCLRGINTVDYENILAKFLNGNEVLYVILDKETFDKPYEDEKITIDKDSYNNLAKAYRYADAGKFRWKRSLFKDDQFDEEAANLLVYDILSAFNDADDPRIGHSTTIWKFFVTAILCEDDLPSSISNAKKILPELFHKFTQRSFTDHRSPYSLSEMLRSFDLSQTKFSRISHMSKMLGTRTITYIFSRKEIELDMGLGKAVADQYFGFKDRNFNLKNYSEPIAHSVYEFINRGQK